MKRIWILALLINLSSFANEHKKIFEVRKPENIQVLIEKDITGAILEVNGPYYIFNPEDGSRLSSGLLGKRFLVHGQNEGLRWGEQFPGIHQICLTPRSLNSTILVNGIQYSGSISVYQIDNKISIVNDINVEEYIKSILAPLFPFPLEKEVMASIAIIARTNAYYLISKGQNSFWDIDAKSVNYQGSTLVDNKSILSKSIDSTKNLILVHPNQGQNLPFAACWTEHSAGKTVPYKSIFRKEGSAPNISVDAPHALIDKEESKWNTSIAKNQLAKLLNLPSVDLIELFIDKESNKVYGARVIENNNKHDYNFIEFQELVGKNIIKSSEFNVKIQNDFLTFKGFGVGHGVGLCLFSAVSLAQNGENALQILSRFFPETYLMNLDVIPSRNKNIVENINERNIFNH
jgi:SpoIID/LytB domain protein